MNGKLYFFVLVLFIFQHKTSISQEKRIPAVLKTEATCDIQCRIRGYFSRTRKIDGECGQAFFFTKFNISIEGNVININFSNGAALFMQDLIKKSLIETNGAWTSEVLDGKKIESKAFILPVWYSFPTKCSNSTDTIFIANGNMYNARPIEFDEHPLDKTRSGYAFLHMLDFGNADDTTKHIVGSVIYPKVEGYILSPAYLYRIH